MSAGLDRAHVQRAFGRAAASYAEHAALQAEVGERLRERLDLALDFAPRRVLDVGCGPAGGAALRQRYDDAQVIALDLALPMLKMGSKTGSESLSGASVAGFDVQHHSLEARKRMAYVPDFPFLYDKLTPAEFLRFTGELFQMAGSQIEAESRELIGRFELREYLNKQIEGLSHGTKQRVAIVSALMHRPEVFILDEPMVGLDPHHARVLKDVLKERSLAGMTVFISTHQLSVAEEMADRIGIMHRGKLIAVGTREELRRQSGVDGALERTFLTLTADKPAVLET
jgi:ABC-2 type transport system ATP-binding protein